MFRKTDIESLKKQIEDLLIRRDYHKLVCLDETNQNIWRILEHHLYRTDEILGWHAIEAVAALMRRKWDSGRREKVLDYMRRLIWSISDESGGIGWSAPQIIAETIAAIPLLNDPFANIMIDRAFNEPALLKSGLWGIGRLGRNIEQSTTLFQDLILAPLNSNDIETVGLAAWAMGEIRLKPALPDLQALSYRTEPVRVYISPSFHEKALGSWALEAIAKIG